MLKVYVLGNERWSVDVFGYICLLVKLYDVNFYYSYDKIIISYYQNLWGNRIDRRNKL